MGFMTSLLVLLGIVGQSADRPAYAAGQIWEYRTRPGEEASLVRIQQIDAMEGGAPVYHISVIGVQIKGGEIQHMPFSKSALDASLTRLSPRKAIFPDASEGIAIWRADNGGMFTVSVAEAVGFVEDVFAKGSKESRSQ